MGLRKEQEKGNDHCIFGKLLNSLWWPVYVIVFVQVEVPSSNRVRKLFCGFESFLGPQKVHGYNRIVCAFKRSIRSGEFGSEPFPH